MLKTSSMSDSPVKMRHSHRVGFLSFYSFLSFVYTSIALCWFCGILSSVVFSNETLGTVSSGSAAVQQSLTSATMLNHFTTFVAVYTFRIIALYASLSLIYYADNLTYSLAAASSAFVVTLLAAFSFLTEDLAVVYSSFSSFQDFSTGGLFSSLRQQYCNTSGVNNHWCTLMYVESVMSVTAFGMTGLLGLPYTMYQMGRANSNRINMLQQQEQAASSSPAGSNQVRTSYFSLSQVWLMMLVSLGLIGYLTFTLASIPLTTTSKPTTNWSLFSAVDASVALDTYRMQLQNVLWGQPLVHFAFFAALGLSTYVAASAWLTRTSPDTTKEVFFATSFTTRMVALIFNWTSFFLMFPGFVYLGQIFYESKMQSFCFDHDMDNSYFCPAMRAISAGEGLCITSTFLMGCTLLYILSFSEAFPDPLAEPSVPARVELPSLIPLSLDVPVSTPVASMYTSRFPFFSSWSVSLQQFFYVGTVLCWFCAILSSVVFSNEAVPASSPASATGNNLMGVTVGSTMLQHFTTFVAVYSFRLICLFIALAAAYNADTMPHSLPAAAASFTLTLLATTSFLTEDLPVVYSSFSSFTDFAYNGVFASLRARYCDTTGINSHWCTLMYVESVMSVVAFGVLGLLGLPYTMYQMGRANNHRKTMLEQHMTTSSSASSDTTVRASFFDLFHSCILSCVVMGMIGYLIFTLSAIPIGTSSNPTTNWSVFYAVDASVALNTFRMQVQNVLWAQPLVHFTFFAALTLSAYVSTSAIIHRSASGNSDTFSGSSFTTRMAAILMNWISFFLMFPGFVYIAQIFYESKMQSVCFDHDTDTNLFCPAMRGVSAGEALCVTSTFLMGLLLLPVMMLKDATAASMLLTQQVASVYSATRKQQQQASPGTVEMADQTQHEHEMMMMKKTDHDDSSSATRRMSLPETEHHVEVKPIVATV